MTNTLAPYPQWFVVACAIVAACALIWLLVKLIKAALWMAFFGALIVAVVAALGLLFR